MAPQEQLYEDLQGGGSFGTFRAAGSLRLSILFVRHIFSSKNPCAEHRPLQPDDMPLTVAGVLPRWECAVLSCAVPNDLDSDGAGVAGIPKTKVGPDASVPPTSGAPPNELGVPPRSTPNVLTSS